MAQRLKLTGTYPDGTTIIGDLRDVRNVHKKTRVAVVVKDGLPPIKLLRRVVGNKVEGFIGAECNVGFGIVVPRRACIALGSSVEGDVKIGQGAVLKNSRVVGPAEIAPFCVLIDKVVVSMGKKISIPEDLYMTSGR